jgi:aryl-alcohol dehydrogenase-like predicted oxidoreductase
MKVDRAETTRRTFIKSAAAATALSAGRIGWAEEGEKPEKDLPALPTRKLGRSGIPVSVLNQGTAFRLTQRMLDYTYSQGVRYLDAADCYGNGASERAIGEWFTRTGKRKEIFLVTKDHPTKGPKQLLEQVDARLEALKTDTIDLFFIHQIGDREYPAECIEWPKSQEFRETAEKLKKSGKCRLVGFSCHHDKRAEFLTAAAEGGFVDAIMMRYDPRTKKNDAMNRAIDACVKAGIGLIAMKTQSSASAFKERWEKLVGDELTVHQAVVKAVLEDERLAGMTSHMVSYKIIDENTAAARDAKPLAADHRALLMEMYAAGPNRLCEGCETACAGATDRTGVLSEAARYVMYYQVYGQRADAREGLRRLRREVMALTNADVAAAQRVCRDGVDYAAIVRQARALVA